MSDIEKLIERLRKRAKEDRDCAKNAEIVRDLLQPELDRFGNRHDKGWNSYAVRMAVDHRNGAERDNRYADDLEEAIATVERLSAEVRRWETSFEGHVYVKDGDYALLAEAAGNPNLLAQLKASQIDATKRVQRLEEALTPSGETKAAFIGEFSFAISTFLPEADEEDDEIMVETTQQVTVPWTTVKEIMQAIRAYAVGGQQ